MRRIIDDVVEKNCKGSSIKEDILFNCKCMPLYEGFVNSKRETISLDKEDYSLSNVSLVNHYVNIFNSIYIAPDIQEGTLNIEHNVSVIPVSIVKLIKTLVIEQINKNEEYSVAVAKCLQYIITEVLSKKFNGKLPKDEDDSLMESIVKEYVEEFIGKVIPKVDLYGGV